MRRSLNRWVLLSVAVLCVAGGFVVGSLHAGRTPREIATALGFDAEIVLADTSPESLPGEGNAVPEDATDDDRPITVLLTGDVLPIADRDYLAGVASLIGSADVAVCNLECPISSHGARIPLKLNDAGRAMDNEFFFRAPPVQAERLAEAGFDIATLANNHIMDFGGEALLETLTLLDEAEVGSSGAGPDSAAAREPALATAGGQTIAFLSYVDADTLPGTSGFAASDETAGTVFVHGDGAGQPDAASAAMLRNDIRVAGDAADLVIACFHWGTEGADEPDPLQRRLAHLAIDAGAHMVVGHHPHRLQGVEIYRGRPIAYSLGNFVFPTPWEANQFSAALELTVENGEWTQLTLHPIRLTHIVGSPRPASGAEGERILQRLTTLSRALGTKCELIDKDPARLRVTRSSVPPDDGPSDVEGAFTIADHPSLDGMSTVSFLAWDIEGERKVARSRTVVVNNALAADVLEIFRQIYEDEERFPIHEVIGYDYRTVAGSEDRLSYHAVGRAIDINRAQNPMVQNGEKIVHPDEPPYEPGEWRPADDPYSIPASGSVVDAFTSRGWRWGGTWTSCKDYQHFDKPR